MPIHKIVIPTPFAVGDVNSYLMEGDMLTLVDAGPKTPDAWKALKKGIEQAGFRTEDVEQVVLTHHHPDHAGWVDGFPDARLYGHIYNDAWLKRDEAFLQYHDAFYSDRLHEEGVPGEAMHWVEKMKRPVQLIGSKPLDGYLKEEDQLPGHPEWLVMETPGHAQSHLAFWNPVSGELIGGDNVLATVSSNPLIEPPLDPEDGRPKSLIQYNSVLKRLLEMPVNIVYSGHGIDVRNIHELIAARLVNQHERAMKVYGMLADEKATTYELAKRLFPRKYEKELGLTLSETIGQLDYLLEDGLITEQTDDRGVLWYARA
ncbi:MBL fold metallo-hydrolase [Planococcus lenghuensis]|uniref:MBL fold metallo-hydrolase n=1 Tax=Planococcus lenghuensis TaxID=2213202 RepID=A0A1Q2KY71_9BACL|nr:MBL fold metallo-hydrolase [Planococcus lenghuensis]AQQ53054.1 MBL fold metallo-hydrolase [Planococcus lenghuensis]